jgi:hypothetical protein
MRVALHRGANGWTDGVCCQRRDICPLANKEMVETNIRPLSHRFCCVRGLPLRMGLFRDRYMLPHWETQARSVCASIICRSNENTKLSNLAELRYVTPLLSLETHDSARFDWAPRRHAHAPGLTIAPPV